MMRHMLQGAAALAMLLASAALGQEAIVSPTLNVSKSAQVFDDGTKHASNVSPTNPLPTKNDTIGAKTDPSSCATDGTAATQIALLKCAISRLTAAVTALQGTLTVQQSSLPSYASTPTFNLGTAPTLTISNTAFGITGTPTFNIGTAPSLTVASSALPTGAATAAGLSALLAALNTPAQAPAAATSIAAAGTVTSSGVTATGGTAPIFSGGTAVIPFTPQIGLPIRLVLRGGATMTSYIGTSIDNCTTINQLTAGGIAVSYTASVDEYVDIPVTTATAASIKHCLVMSVSAGTETYGVRQ